jgi:hypothetical protein
MEKKIIYYMNEIINNDNKIYNSYANLIHLGFFTFSNNKKILLNGYEPLDIVYDDLWFDLGISSEKKIKCVMVLSGNKTFENLFSNYDIYYQILSDFITTKKYIIKGLDLEIENCATIENTKKFINDFKRDFPDLLLVLSTIGYSMCVKDIDTKYENEKEWSYALFNKSPEGNKIDYYNCYFNEDNFTIDSLEDIIDNGFNVEKIIMGCDSQYFQDYDNYFELRCIAKKYPNIGGTFIKYFNDSPYKWDLSVWLCLTSR